MPEPIYVTPRDHQPLVERDDGMESADKRRFPFLLGVSGNAIPRFVDGPVDSRQQQYHDPRAVAIYDNYLAWLFATFGVDEASFRSLLVAKMRLRPGSRALVTGCGLGNDLPFVSEAVGPSGAVYAQDLSGAMVVAAQERTSGGWYKRAKVHSGGLYYSVSDACELPFPDGHFDAALHFGGLNEFPDRRVAIAEMARVVRRGGRVVFGDEGVAPWLRDTDYGRMAVRNNRLWATEAPIALLPANSADANLTWVLGNCFYLIEFEVAEGLPFINPDVPHKGGRGGSMRTRYYGELEGVDPELKARAYAAAGRDAKSVCEWLETAIRGALGTSATGKRDDA